MAITSRKLREPLSTDFDTAIQQLADVGIGVEARNWADEETERLKEEEDFNELEPPSWKENITVPVNQFSSGLAQMFTELVAAPGAPIAWLKGQVGLSDDPHDNWFFQAGTKMTEMAEIDHLPNRFRSGKTGFFLSDVPKGLGSAGGFIASGGGWGAVGKGVALKTASASSRKLTTMVGLRAAVKEQVKVLEKTYKIGRVHGGYPGAPASGSLRKSAVGSVRQKAKALNARLTKGRELGTLAGIGGTGAAVQAQEGYRDAINHLRQQAIAQGKDPDDIDYDEAFTAWYSNLPAGLFELLGAELAVLRTMRGATKIKDLAKYGGDDLALKTWRHRSAVQLYNNLDKVSRGRFTRGLAAFSRKYNGNKWVHGTLYTGGMAGREFLQEGAQAAWLNMVASDIAGYDKNRKLFDNVLHSGGVGGVVGTVFGIASLILGGKRMKLKKIQNLRDQEEKMRDAGNEEAADSLAAQASEQEEEFMREVKADRPGADNEMETAETGPVINISPTVAKDEELNLTPASTEAAPATTEEAAPTATAEVTPITTEEAAEEDLLGWGEVPTTENSNRKAAPTPATVQAAIAAGVPVSSVGRTKSEKQINEKAVLTAIDKKIKQDAFDEKATETQTDDEIAKNINEDATELVTVKREGSPNPKDGKVWQVVALDKYGNEIAKLSPLMERKKAAAFMHGPVLATWSNLTARTENKNASKGVRGPGKARAFDEESFSRKIQDERDGIGDLTIPNERKAFVERFKGKANPKHFKHKYERASGEIQEEVAARKAAEDKAAEEPAAEAAWQGFYNALPEGSAGRKAVDRKTTDEDKLQVAKTHLERRRIELHALKGAEGRETEAELAGITSLLFPKAAKKKRAVSPKVKEAAKAAADKVKAEQDFIDSINEELGDNPLSPEQEAESRREFSEGLAAAAEPVAKPELTPEAAEATAAPVEPAPTEEAGYGGTNTIVTKEEYEKLAKELRELGGSLGGAVGLEAAARLSWIGTRAAFYHIEAGSKSFKQFARKMIEEFGPGIKNRLAGWYSAAHHAPEMKGMGTRLVKDFDATIKQVEKDIAKGTEKKPAKKTGNKGRRKATNKRRAAVVKKKIDPQGKLKPSPRQAGSKEDTEPTLSDLKASMGQKPTIINDETEQRVGDVENLGPFKTKGPATRAMNKKVKEVDLEQRLTEPHRRSDREYWVVENKDGTYSIHSETKAPAVELITEDNISSLDAALKKREAETHEEAMAQYEDAPVTIGAPGTPALREGEELREDNEEEQALKDQKQRILGKLGPARQRKNEAMVRELTEQLHDIDLQLMGRIENQTGRRVRGLKGGETIFRSSPELAENAIIPGLQPEALSDEISVGPSRAKGAKVSDSVALSPDKHFTGEAVRFGLIEEELDEKKKKTGELVLTEFGKTLPDMAEIHERGLSAVVKDRLISLIKQGALWEGLPVISIEFRTGTKSAPMFTMPETGSEVINVDLSKLANRMSGLITTISYSGGVKKTQKNAPPTLTEMLNHELHHVTLWRAIKLGYIKTSKEGKAADFNNADFTGSFGRVNDRNIEVLEMMLSRDGEGRTDGRDMFDLWRAHVAIQFGQETADQLEWLPNFQQQVSKKDEKGIAIKDKDDNTVMVDKPYKGKIHGGARASNYNQGVEWLVFLMEYAGRNRELAPGGYETIKFTTKKYLEYLSLLSDQDVKNKVPKRDASGNVVLKDGSPVMEVPGSIPVGVQLMIDKATLLVGRNNAFVQRLAYLDKAEVAAMRRLEAAYLEIEKYKVGEVTFGKLKATYDMATEPANMQNYISGLWEYMSMEAYQMGQIFDAVSPHLPKGMAEMWVREDGKSRSKRVTVSLEQDWHTQSGPRVVKTTNDSAWTQSLAGLARRSGNTVQDIKRNNPNLVAQLKKDGRIAANTWVLLHSTSKYSYGTGAATKKWFRQSSDRILSKKRKDSSEVAVNIDAIFFKLSKDATYQGSMQASLEADPTITTEMQEQEAFKYRDEIPGGLMNPVITEGTAGEITSDEITAETTQPGMTPESQGAEDQSSLDQQAASDTIADMLREEVSHETAERVNPADPDSIHGQPIFYPIRDLGFFLSPFTMGYALRALARNTFASGDSFATNYDRAAKEIRSYHNSRVTDNTKIIGVVESLENEAAMLERTKPKGYTVLLKQVQTQLAAQEKRLMDHTMTYFGDMGSGARIVDVRFMSLSINARGVKQKISITGTQLEKEIIPAFREAVALSEHTGQTFRIAEEANRAQRAEATGEFGFPTPFSKDEIVQRMKEIVGIETVDGATALSVDGLNTYQPFTVEEIRDVSDRTNNYVRTGDVNSTEEATNIGEVVERAALLESGFRTEDGGLAMIGEILERPRFQHQAVMDGIIKAAVHVIGNPGAITDAIEDLGALAALQNTVTQQRGELVSQGAQAMRAKQALEESSGHLKARIGYESILLNLQHNTFGEVVNDDWVWKFKGLIHKAGEAAALSAIINHTKTGGIDPVTAMIESGIFHEASDVTLRNAVSGAMLEVSGKEVVSQSGFETEFLKQLADREISHDMDQKQQTKIVSMMMRLWKAQREADLKDIIKAEHGVFIGGKVTLDVLLQSVTRLLAKSDGGAMNLDLKATRTVSRNNLEVLVSVTAAWDAIAPAAFKRDTGFFGDSISRKLMEWEREIEQKNLKGVRAADIRNKMVMHILKNMPVNYTDLVRDLWFAGALAGVRTWVDVATGSIMHGAFATLLLSAELAAFKTGKSRKDALKVMVGYVSGLWEGGDGFVHILKTGDLSKLPDANARLEQQLEHSHDAYGGLALEGYSKTGLVGAKYAGVLKYVRRIVLGLDYIGATAGRKAMMVYGASERQGMFDEMIETETNPTKLKELKERKAKLEKAYTAGMLLNDKATQEKAMEDSIREIHNEKYVATELTDADIKVHRKEPLVKARMREIMEADLAAADDLVASASEIGRVFALNAEPIGLGGIFHNMLQSSGVFKYPLGAAFSRAAMNMASNASNWIPIFSMVNYARSRDNSMTRHIAKQPWGKVLNIAPSTALSPNVGKEGGEVMSRERANIIRAQAITSTALGIAVLGALRYKDDDDWDIIGNLKSLPIARQRQLRSQGVMPHSIKIGDHYIGYKNWPQGAWLHGLGAIRDGEKWDNWDERTAGKKFLDMTMGGFGFMIDIRPATQMIGLLESMDRTGDTASFVERFSSTAVQNWVGPILTPNLIKEMDTWILPGYHKAGKDQVLGHYFAQMPILRQLNRPMLNAFGEQVEISRAPWDRWYTGPARVGTQQARAAKSREWVLVGKWAKQDVFLPTAARGRQIVALDEGGLPVKRDMTPAELQTYTLETGQMLKTYITRNIDALEKATPSAAKRWLDKTSSAIKKKVAAKVGHAARTGT